MHVHATRHSICDMIIHVAKRLAKNMSRQKAEYNRVRLSGEFIPQDNLKRSEGMRRIIG